MSSTRAILSIAARSRTSLISRSGRPAAEARGSRGPSAQPPRRQPAAAADHTARPDTVNGVDTCPMSNSAIARNDTGYEGSCGDTGPQAAA